MTDKTFAIVGGGIGGLTLAIALQRKKFNVTVFENTAELKPVGAGLMLAGNAVKALIEIGISEEVLHEGKVIKAMYIKDAKGQVLTTTDVEKLSAKFGTINNFSIHRADLHRVLISQLKPGTLQLGKACTDFAQSPSGVTLAFDDGTQAQADFLIACDGIHSVIRKKLLPDSSPRYAGYTCWRAVINDLPTELNLNETIEIWGLGSRFGIVPLSRNRVYWFACLNAKANDPLMRSLKVPDLLMYFNQYHSPVTDILKKTKTEQLIQADIMDLKPLKKFAFKKIVLMGDAAHATTPNLGQGACMAIEDAAVLSNCLEQYETAEEAFLKFEIKRIPRTTTIANASRQLGRIAQLQNPILTGLRNTLMKLTPPAVAEKQLRYLTDVSFL